MKLDPDSRRRLSRANPEADRVEASFPELRIIDDELWGAVQQARANRAAAPLVYRRRPRHFLSGLARCGEYGGNFVVVVSGRWGCSRHREAGTCSNERRIGTDELAVRVLSGLQEQLLAPEAVNLLIREYRFQREQQMRRTARERTTAERRLADLDGATTRLVDAIADGTADLPEVRAAIQARRAERDQLRRDLAEQDADNVIALHPQIAAAYCARIEALARSLAEQSHHNAVALQIRELIKVVIVKPRDSGGCAIGVVGSLAAVLSMAACKPPTGGGTHRLITVVAEAQGSPSKTMT